MFYNKGGRHYWFAKYLEQEGYRPVIFSCNVKHGSLGRFVETDDLWIEQQAEDINVPFVLVNSSLYKGNGIDRIKNMFGFYRNVKKVAKAYAKKHDVPDVIYASSVHPLSLVAGIQLAKYFGIKCICEIRDLWPESIVAYSNKLTKSNAIVKLLYQGERWIYKKADKLIFTVEGGADYIKDQGWDKENKGPIDISKVHHINNGVDIKAFDNNVRSNVYEDDDLDNPDTFNLVYTGSIRQANNLKIVVDAAKNIQNSNTAHKCEEIKFLLFGDGDERENLQKRCLNEKISNVVFKGKVEKKYVPNILSKASVNILNYSNHEIWKYGGSQNKSFEYLASGKPILSTITMGYDIIEKYNAGITLKRQDPETISEAVISFFNMDEKIYNSMAQNARNAAQDYDYIKLAKKLIDIIESV